MKHPRKLLNPFIIACTALVVFALTGCGTSKKINKDFLYFQNGLDSIQNIQRTPVLIKVNDVLGIQVTSRSMNQEQVAVFNLTAAATGQGYQVDVKGNVEMPYLGSVKAAGLTREQLQESLKESLSAYIKNPAVTVRFTDFKINVLGEVKIPGMHSFDKERVTVIDAISAAGDLTDFGKRNNILIIREENQERKYYEIDLRSGSLFQSPAYQLQPNDIIYVNATDRKLRIVNTNPDSVKGWQLFLGITSVVTTIASLIITIKNSN